MIEAPTIAWDAFHPEIIAAVGAMVALLVAVIRRPWAQGAAIIIGIGGALGMALAALGNFDQPLLGAWSGQLEADRLANLARILVAVTAMGAIVMAPWTRPKDGRGGEHVALILLAACGMGLFAAAGSLVSLFVGLELFSIALYVLAALEADDGRRLEAGIKYLILGGISSAIMLYGIALVYGATGTFTLPEIGVAADRGPLLWVGLALLLSGLIFKASAAPLHFWTPDVYDGAPTVAVGFMASATKVAAFVGMIRVLQVGFGVETDFWEPLVATVAVVSIVVGNLGALAQDTIKRMLAYSSIAHAGYLLVAVTAHEAQGIAAAGNYLVIYAITTAGTFALVAMRERQVGHELRYADLDGSGWPSQGAPLLSALPGVGMVILVLSMAGIPPTAGFFAKVGIFHAALTGGYGWLVVIAVLGSIVSLGYYLRIIVHMYMREPADSRQVETRQPVIATVGVLAAAVVLWLGIVPGTSYEPAEDAASDLQLAQ